LLCAGRWWSGTGNAGSPGATVLLPGATPTTWCTGRTAGPPPWPTWCCCVAGTTGWSITASPWRWPTAGRSSEGRMGRFCRIERRHKGEEPSRLGEGLRFAIDHEPPHHIVDDVTHRSIELYGGLVVLVGDHEPLADSALQAQG